MMLSSRVITLLHYRNYIVLHFSQLQDNSPVQFEIECCLCSGRSLVPFSADKAKSATPCDYFCSVNSASITSSPEVEFPCSEAWLSAPPSPAPAEASSCCFLYISSASL